MPSNACCSQALLFPSVEAPALVDWLDENRLQKTGKMTDSAIDRYADTFERTRWALTPCLVQHVGKKSSKKGADGGWDTAGRQNPRERLWSFGFEKEGRKLMKYSANGWY
jgi:hypothetical protein